MMTKIVSAAAVLAIAGSALAQGNIWNLRGTVNFDQVVGGNPPSAGIVPSTSFYNDALGAANGGPNPAFFVAFPDLRFDSYWALDNGPSSESNGQAAAYDGSAGAFTMTNSLAKNPAGFATPGVGKNAFLETVNGEEGWVLFLGRLTTLGAGSTLANDLDGGAVFGRIGVWTGSGVANVQLTLNGPGVEGPAGLDGSLTNTYFLVSQVFETTLANGTVVTVHDLYVTTVPTPGAVALFGLAGLAAARRRRRA